MPLALASLPLCKLPAPVEECSRQKGGNEQAGLPNWAGVWMRWCLRVPGRSLMGMRGRNRRGAALLPVGDALLVGG